MSTTSPEAIDKLKHAPDVAGVEDLIRRRWSPRAYADKDVPAAELKRLFEAARWAASSSNEQPWRFLVGRRGDQTYEKIFNALVEFNQGWAKSASVWYYQWPKRLLLGKINPMPMVCMTPARLQHISRCRRQPTDCTPTRWRVSIMSRSWPRLEFLPTMRSARSRRSATLASREFT